jgi:hypothetical protein
VMVIAVPVPTVRVSVGVEFVSVPSVAWMAKLNVPEVALPNVTVNGAPAAVGASGGEGTQIWGAPVVQLRVTVPVYPFKAVSVPFQIAL